MVGRGSKSTVDVIRWFLKFANADALGKVLFYGHWLPDFPVRENFRAILPFETLHTNFMHKKLSRFDSKEIANIDGYSTPSTVKATTPPRPYRDANTKTNHRIILVHVRKYNRFFDICK